MLLRILGSIFTEILGAFGQHPVFFVFLALAAIAGILFRLPGVKGWIGETIMRIGFALFLPKDTYRVINNVTIPDERGGTTQIDHVIVSVYGVFVVETKHYKGWIFGGEKDRKWTQKIHGGHSQKFQNPLHQNYKHTECLASLLGLSPAQIKSVIVFTGDCKLKTKEKLPDHVTYPGGCMRYIKSQTEIILDETAVQSLEATIQEKRLTPGWKTAREHVTYVKSLHSTDTEPQVPVTSAPAPIQVAPTVYTQAEMICPRCGASMILRTSKRGANAGGKFWGCSNYPKCREIVNIPSADAQN